MVDSAPATTGEVDDTLTGTRAPRKGESGFRQLPECFGIRATILGGPGDDRISGTRREDVIVTFGGADVVTDLGRDDAVCSGTGDDTVRSTSEDRRSTVWAVDLGAGNDDLRVTEAFDIFGGRGADRIVVVQGPAEVSGGPGADYLRAITTKRPYGIAENAPCLYFADSPRPVRVNLDQEWARERDMTGWSTSAVSMAVATRTSSSGARTGTPSTGGRVSTWSGRRRRRHGHRGTARRPHVPRSG